MSRADRVAARLGEREARPAAGHRPRQHPLPDRLHRLERDGGRRPATCAASSPTSATSSARRPRSTGFDRERAPQEFARGAQGGLARGRAAARLRGPARVSVRQHARLREVLPGPHRAGGRGRPGRGRARGQGARRDRGDPRRRGARRRHLRLAVRARASSGAPSARSRSRSRRRCAAAARAARASPRSSPSAEHGALPHAEPRDVEIPPRHARHARHRRAARRLLLGLHAHVGDRRARRTTSPRSTTLVLRAQEAALEAVRPGPDGARDRRRRARHHRRRRPRRALRPRARPRRRARGPRGARGWRARRRTRSWRAMS